MNLEPTLQDVLSMHLRQKFRFVPNPEEINEIIDICQQEQPLYHMRKQEITDMVCNSFGATWEEIKGPSRKTKIKIARHVWIAMVRGIKKNKEKSVFSHAKIGEEIGGRDHSTMIHAERNVSKWITENGLTHFRMTTILAHFGGETYFDKKTGLYKCLIPCWPKQKPLIDLK